MTMEAVRDAVAPTHPPVAEKVACVDFDGTIAPWGEMFSFPEPIPGAVEAIKRLKSAGYKVVIFTSRLSSVWHEAEGWNTMKATGEQLDYLREYCERYDIPADAATAEKIPAEVYLDDKALTVDNQHSLLAQTEQFLSEGLFVLKHNYRGGPKWHRLRAEPTRSKPYTATGVTGAEYYRWSADTVCGQVVYFPWSGPNLEDLYSPTSKWSKTRLANRRDAEYSYCQHCVKQDRKREKNA